MLINRDGSRLNSVVFQRKITENASEAATTASPYACFRSLCGKENIEISYINDDSVFTIEFSRSDRNAEESNGTINGITNGTINTLEENILSLLMKNPRYTSSDLIEKTNKSLRTINRTLASLKAKRLIKRVGSNKSGHWEIER